jgi:hypothetical protein
MFGRGMCVVGRRKEEEGQRVFWYTYAHVDTVLRGVAPDSRAVRHLPALSPSRPRSLEA